MRRPGGRGRGTRRCRSAGRRQRPWTDGPGPGYTSPASGPPTCRRSLAGGRSAASRDGRSRPSRAIVTSWFAVLGPRRSKDGGVYQRPGPRPPRARGRHAGTSVRDGVRPVGMGASVRRPQPRDVMRLLGVLGSVAPVALGSCSCSPHESMSPWVDEGCARRRGRRCGRRRLAHRPARRRGHYALPIRSPRQGRRADRRGRLQRPRSSHGARPRAAAWPRRQRHRDGARRHARPGDGRPPDRRRQPPVAAGRCSPRSSARPATSGRSRSPSSTSTTSRPSTTPTATPSATSSCAASPRRSAENLRASDMIGRYGGEEFMLILTETDVEEGAVLTEKLRTLVQRQRFAVEGTRDRGHDLDRHRRRRRPGAADGHPRPRRRRRDVLGQVARAQPDLHLRRARRRRPRAACPDLAGRPGPRRRDRPAAREAATAALTSVLARCPTTAASRRR